MNTQQKQRLLWIGGIVIVLIYYVVPSMINASRQAEYRRRLAERAAAAKAAKPLPPPANAPAPFDSELGTWQGIAPLPVGLCNLKFELRRKESEPGHFAGFPVLSCTPFPLGTPSEVRSAMQQGMIAQMSPISAVLTGTASNGGIQFTVDKVLGTTANGCALTGFSVTPFGKDQIAAEWQEGTCPGGRVLLKRMGK